MSVMADRPVKQHSPDVTCKGLTFLPVPEFDAVAVIFGAPVSAYFSRNDLPEVPPMYVDEATRMFVSGGKWPQFGADVNVRKARVAIHAWLSSFAPTHEAKIATVAYALWVWSPKAAGARADAKP